MKKLQYLVIYIKSENLISFTITYFIASCNLLMVLGSIQMAQIRCFVFSLDVAVQQNITAGGYLHASIIFVAHQLMIIQLI